MYLNCVEKGQKVHTKCYMITNTTPKFKKTFFPGLSQIRSIQSVFGRNRTGTGYGKKMTGLTGIGTGYPVAHWDKQTQITTWN